MNPFEQLTKTLARSQPAKPIWQPGLHPKSQTRVGTIRCLLKAKRGP